MSSNNNDLGQIEGVMIIVSGLVLFPVMLMDGLFRGVLAYLKNAKEADFIQFFSAGLGMDEVQAKNAAFRYLACAAAFRIAPGFGASDVGQKFDVKSAADLAAELANAKICPSDKVKLRISEYLQGFKSPQAAGKGLSPAKRDALVMEARKLLALPTAVFRPFYRSSTSAVGLRG